jgi:hypothetical protein
MRARRSRGARFVALMATAGALTIGGGLVGDSSPSPLAVESAWAACAGPSGRTIYDRTHVSCRRAGRVLRKVLDGNLTPGKWLCNKTVKICARNRRGGGASSFFWR